MKKYLLFIFATSLVFGEASNVLSQGTAFTYQGRLNDHSVPANGTYGMVFNLCSTPDSGGQIANLGIPDVPVTNGLFTVMLDFGANFPGADRWLEINVKTNNAASFTTLSPRQKLTPTPYAITAGNLTGTLPAAQLSGTLPSSLLSGVYSGAVTLSNPANHLSGDGGGLSGVDALTLAGFGPGSFWRLDGNAGTTAGINFLGTTDNQPLEFKVNGQRAFRLEPTVSAPNVIGGSSANAVSTDVVGATISGGNYNSMSSGSPNALTHYATISGGQSNAISAGYAAVGGGHLNTVDAESSTVAGGIGNFVGGYAGAIGGGRWNSIQAAEGPLHPLACTIGGGSENQIASGNHLDGFSDYSTISGGESNSVMSEADHNVIGGGGQNLIGNGASYCFIGGGSQNSISTGGLDNLYDTIAGGHLNLIPSFGLFPAGPGRTISGGIGNIAGGYVATIPGGAYANASNYGQMAYASGRFETVGDAQTSVYVCRGETTDTNLTQLSLDGRSERMQIPANSTWSFEVLVSGRSANGNSACYDVRGAIKNNGGTTGLVGVPILLQLGQDIASCNANVAAVGGALIVQVNGAAGTTMRWSATVRTAEVTF